MSQNPYDRVAETPPVPPPLPIAPPTVPGALSRPQTRPAWPTVIGVIAIVFGALGLLQNLWGAASMFMFDTLSGFVPAGEVNPFAALVKWRVPLTATYALAFLVSLLLLLGGVWLILRKAAASPMLVSWAILKMLITMVLTAMTVLMQMEQFNAMQSASNPGMPAMGAFMTPFLIVGAIFGVLWGWALPIFMLVWFARKGVKETVRGWRDERAGLAGTGV